MSDLTLKEIFLADMYEKEIEIYKDVIKNLIDATEDLLSEQNGPPLVQSANDWKNAVDKCNDAIAKAKEML
jgi:hypothetical protein